MKKRARSSREEEAESNAAAPTAATQQSAQQSISMLSIIITADDYGSGDAESFTRGACTTASTAAAGAELDGVAAAAESSGDSQFTGVIILTPGRLDQRKGDKDTSTEGSFLR